MAKQQSEESEVFSAGTPFLHPITAVLCSHITVPSGINRMVPIDFSE